MCIFVIKVFASSEGKKRKIQQRIFSSVEAAVKFGRECRKKYDNFYYFEIFGVTAENNEKIKIMAYGMTNNTEFCEATSPAKISMLALK